MIQSFPNSSQNQTTPSVNRFGLQQAKFKFSGSDSETPKSLEDKDLTSKKSLTPSDKQSNQLEDSVEIHKSGQEQTSGDLKVDNGNSSTNTKSIDNTSSEEEPAAKKQSNLAIRLKETKGLFFWKVVPLIFSLSFFAPPLGFIVGLAGIPISYLSGKYGRKVLRNIQPDQLSNMSKLVEMLERPENLKDGQVVEQLNLVAQDMLNGIPVVRHAPRAVRFLANLPKRMPWLLSLFPSVSKKLQSLTGKTWKFSKDKGLGKLLNTRVMLKANVLTRVANSNSIGAAAINGTKGALNYFFWMKMVAPLGRMISGFANVMPGFFKWPFKAAGVAVENAALIKMGFDIMKSGKEADSPNQSSNNESKKNS